MYSEASQRDRAVFAVVMLFVVLPLIHGIIVEFSGLEAAMKVSPWIFGITILVGCGPEILVALVCAVALLLSPLFARKK